MASLDQPLSAGTTRAPTRGWSEYTQLSRQVKHAGLLERRHGWYVAKIALNLVLLAAGGIAFLLLGASWWQLGTAVYLAVVATQLGFVGHDAGHRQIFRRRRANDLVGLVHANLLVGISFGWWVPKHNAHHTNPNDEDLDPDIGIAALAFTAAQASSKRGLARVIARSQAVLVLPPAVVGGRPPPCGQHHLGPQGPRPGQPDRGAAAAGPCRGLCDGPGAGPDPAPGGRLRPGPTRPVRPVSGLFVRPQPQGHAHPHPGRPARLLAPPGPDLPQRPRQPPGRLPPGGPQLPDRAPPVPQHAPPQPAPRPAPGPRVLPPPTTCPTPKPACSAPTPRPCATSTPSAPPYGPSPRASGQGGMPCG